MSNLRRVSLYIMYITDLAAFLAAFLVAYPIRTLLPVQEQYTLPEISAYYPLLTGTVIAYVLVAFLLLYNDNFSGRKTGEEIAAAARMVAVVMALNVLIFYFTRTSTDYSRLFVAVFIVLSFLIDVFFRMIVKKVIIPRYKTSRGSEHLVIVTEEQRLENILDRLDDEQDWRFQVSGLILVDTDHKGERIHGLPVLSNREDALKDMFDQEVDSVLLALPPDISEKEWVEALQGIGKTVYVHLDEFYYSESRRMLDYLGDCAVVSYLPAMPVRGRKLVIKRFLDVLASVALLPFVLFACLIVGIVNAMSRNRMPVIIGRERVGKNGRRFHMYHFRTQKRANRDEGTGDFISSAFGKMLTATHLDGLPMVFNVLVGDMSFVGPQAVSVQRVREGDLYVVRNLCTRPGIVGVWSSQRSEGKIAELNEYIHTWSMRLDSKLILKSIWRFLTFRSGRIYDENWIAEEASILRAYDTERQPLSYDRTCFGGKTGVGILWYNAVKRCADIVGALLGIILLSWLFLILIILIIADDGGNPFYGHARIGKDGKRIKVWKFRSMRQNTGDLSSLLTPEQLEQYRKEFKIDNDPRITKIGNFLRKSSLDELPQLFNILKGDLSIVGPRPIVEEETAIYGKDIAKLLSVKPGLTGYWQAYARNNATYETGERQRMEMYYVDHQGLLMDVRILFRTVRSVSKQEGAQ